MIRVALLGTAVLAVLAGSLLWSLQRQLIYYPNTAPVPAAPDVIPGARDVTLRTSDDLRLGAWFVPAGRPERGVTVLVCSGNAGDRSLRAPLAAALASHGLSVLLFDYRGYGGNPGAPSEEGLAKDVRAAHRYLVEHTDDRLIYLGESLGAAVATGLAVEHPPEGLLLRSPFVDLGAVGRHHYPYLPVRALLRDQFPVREQLSDIDVPTVVVYGTADSVVPAEQSRSVAEAAAGPVTVVKVAGADHNDPRLLEGAALIDAVVALADRIR